MAEATRPDRPPPSFGSRWGLPILIGCAGGVLCVFLTMGTLIDQFGPLLGGLAGVGVGVGVSVLAILLNRLIGRALFPESAPAADRRGT